MGRMGSRRGGGGGVVVLPEGTWKSVRAVAEPPSHRKLPPHTPNTKYM